MVGMQKAGTSWFYKQFDTHPSVVMSSEKEVHYWDMHFSKGPTWYEGQWPSPPASPASPVPPTFGEITPDYLNLPAHLVKAIHDYNPKMKIIMCVPPSLLSERARQQKCLGSRATRERRRCCRSC